MESEHRTTRPAKPTRRTWLAKFSDAFRGIGWAIRGSSSFYVHLAATGLVVGFGMMTGVTPEQWRSLLLCITIVLAAETFNSALESMARAFERDYNPELGRALDMASGAVLIASMGASIVGLTILGQSF